MIKEGVNEAPTLSDGLIMYTGFGRPREIRKIENKRRTFCFDESGTITEAENPSIAVKVEQAA